MIRKLTSNSLYFAWILLIFLSLIWGSSFILVKKGLTAFTPMQVASIRVTAAFFTLALVAIPKLKKIPRDKWKFVIYSGISGSFIPAFLFAYAQTRLDSALTGVLNALTPLFTLVFGYALFQQEVTRLKIYGIFIGLLGSIGLILSTSQGGMFQINPYALLVIGATILYGLNVNVVKVYLSELRPIVVSTSSIFIIGPLAITSFFATNSLDPILHDPDAWLPFIYLVLLGMFSTAIALVFFYRLIQFTSAIFASSVTYLIPVVAIVWGVADGEVLSINQILFISLILVGVYLINYRKREVKLYSKS